MKKKRNQLLIFLALLVISAVILFPLVAAFFTSLKPKSEIITSVPQLLPQDFTFDNYKRVFFKRNIMMYFNNSMAVAIMLTVINLVLSLLGAFALVWKKQRLTKQFSRILLITYMLPTVLFAMPYYMMCGELGLLNRRVGLVITYLAFSLPFSIWMLKNSFENLPTELLEAGTLDGCNDFKIITKIVIPVSLPAVSVVTVYSFIVGVSEYMFASTLMTVESTRTLPIMLSMLTGRYHTDFGLLMAASMVMMLPIILLYFLVQKYFVDGIISGAVKN